MNWLIRRFVPESENVYDPKVRERYGLFSGVLGIFCNLLLFVLKIIMGYLMNSIAITSDAFNNLSDTGSSLITIVGAKMSSRPADQEHPFGHGRFEYIASLVVSFIILFFGLTLLKSSVLKIFTPQPVRYSFALLLLLSSSILVKMFMYQYNRYIAKKIDSPVHRATASDSLNDVYATLSVVLSLVAGRFTSLPVDGVVGVVVSLIILYTGFQVAKDTTHIILGLSPDPDLEEKLNAILEKNPTIRGYHDLQVHDYGPGRRVASVHAEVPCELDMVSVHYVIDQMEKTARQELDLDLVIHMDPVLSDGTSLDGRDCPPPS